MIILHAGLLAPQFLLWGETSAENHSPASPKSRSGRSPAKRRGHPGAFPYGALAARLAEALQESGIHFKIGKKDIASANIWVPTADAEVVSSSALIAEPPKANAKMGLRPRKIDALRLPPDRAIELLSHCAGRETLASGVIIGKDLAFWVTALHFAAALMAKEHFLPGMIEQQGHYQARWEPVFSAADGERLSQLAGNMPASGRALSFDDSAPPGFSSLSVLKDFVTLTLDSLIRSSAVGTQTAEPLPRFPRKKGMDFDSLHDHWIHALSASNGAMEGDPAALRQLLERNREWQRPLSISTAAPFRLCFRVEEPKEEGDEKDNWYVRYLLQANQDPSLIIPAKDVWNGKGLPGPMGGDGQAREYLLLSLGQASGMCPHIETSLKSACPPGYRLDAAGAHEFLTQKALALEQSGFGVILPAWWTRKGSRLRMSARAKVKTPAVATSAGLTLDEIVQFDWEMALGGETLSYDELQRLAKLKAPLVKVRGQWVQVNAEEIQAALEFWKKKGRGRPEMTVREIIRMALGGSEGPRGIPVEGITSEGWITDFLKVLDRRVSFQELAAPPTFPGGLRPYQLRGYSWLNFLRQWGLGACLADDMGLGKTIQTLALIQRDWHGGKRSPVLLICPTSVVNNWQKEAARFTPDLPLMVHHGFDRARGDKFKAAALRQAIVVSSYALLHRDLEVLREVDWGGVILDEAQNIKNPETKQARAARAIPAEYRIALTGTPVENNVGDLWSIMEFLNSGFLGSQTEFKRNFFIPIQAARDRAAAAKLKRLTEPFVLRRLKTDRSIIADLPEKMEMRVFCTLTKEQASLYEAVVNEAFQGLDDAEGIKRKGIVLATLLRLKQVCNHPAQFLGDHSPIPGRSGKLIRLTEMLEEILSVGDRTLVFSQFAEMGAILKRYLQETFGREVLFLHGGVPKAQRDLMVERFQGEEESPPIFILSLKAGGTGLNLTRASRVIHFDRWWNPAVENQATDRAFRIGQTKNVHVHKFICAGTLEDKIDEMIENKKQIAAKVVATGEGWLTELSTAELRNLFALRKEALGE
jgi:SNF2 family DNA or RNA helicase